jgi:hypothetical protein
MILTSDRLGEASRTYSPFAPRNRPYAPARLGPEVLCPGVISQAALIEGGSPRSWHSGRSTLAAVHRLHFDRHYFNFHAIRTTALLALERRDLAAAAEPVERALAMVSGAQPAFNYLAQLDRARTWAAGAPSTKPLARCPRCPRDLRARRV